MVHDPFNHLPLYLGVVYSPNNIEAYANQLCGKGEKMWLSKRGIKWHLLQANFDVDDKEWNNILIY
jgi:hypothetical protein